MKLPYIEYTKVKPTAEMELKGEPRSAFDGTDQGFYEMPWCEAETGDVFAHYHPGVKPPTVHMARKEDDAVVCWNVPAEHTEAAMVVLRKARRKQLKKDIARLQVELEELK
jgi:hypothetical protein